MVLENNDITYTRNDKGDSGCKVSLDLLWVLLPKKIAETN